MQAITESSAATIQPCSDIVSHMKVRDYKFTLVLQAMLLAFQPDRSEIGLGYMFASLAGV